jgi:hypothetical protein
MDETINSDRKFEDVVSDLLNAGLIQDDEEDGDGETE